MLRIGPERGVVFREFTGIGIDLKKLEAEDSGKYALDFVGDIDGIERGFDYLENAGLVLKRDTAGG